jgi:integrase
MTTGFEIERYKDNLTDRARGWSDLNDGERKRRAVEAARDRNLTALWDLTEARLTTWGRAGGRVSPATLEAYQIGVQQVVTAASGINLLAPPRDFGATWIRSLEALGRTTSTVYVRLAGARALWAGLRWAGATEVDPFLDVRAAPDLTAAWDKRQPYPISETDKLLEITAPRETALILLGSHGGLRISETVGLRGQDVDLEGGQARVLGKGGKVRVVRLSRRCCEALRELGVAKGDRFVELTVHGARAVMRRLCAQAGVTYMGTHSLRHQAGTRLYRQTNDLEMVARHLGHVELETARIYAKWSDERLAQSVDNW